MKHSEQKENIWRDNDTLMTVIIRKICEALENKEKKENEVDDKMSSFELD